MVIAYIFVKANTSEADRLRDDILATAGVVEAHIVAGDVDIIAKVEVESPAAVKEIAADTIGSIPGVERTRTYVAMD